MLFSGSVKSYKCKKCHKIFSSITPTSVIPMLAVFIISSIAWAANISELFKLEALGLLLAFFIGLALAFLNFFLAFVLLEKFFSSWEKSKKCPQCGADLESTGGGFVDGAIPGLQELLLYVIVSGAPLGLALMISFYS